MERLQTEKLAFDLRKYQEQDTQRLAADLSSLSMELAANKNERITPYVLKQKGDKLVAPEFDEDSDILEGIKVEDELDWLELQASKRIKEYILNEEEVPLITIWLSPPLKDNNKYPEGRVNIGIGKEEEGVRVIDNWGIASEWTEDTFIQLGNWLNNFSQKPEREFKKSEELRSQPIFIDKQKMGSKEPLEFLEEIIPLDKEIWKKIKSGEIKKIKERNIKKAKAIARKACKEMKGVKRKEEWFYLGARMEEEMQKQIGYQFRAGSGCGILNSEVVSANLSYAYSHTQIKKGKPAEVRVMSAGEAKYVNKCGNCGAAIERRISAGYICPECGGVYKGC